MNFSYTIFMACPLALAVVPIFMACPDGGGLVDVNGPGDGLEGPTVSGVFTSAPGLTFTDDGAAENRIRYVISPAVVGTGVTGAITYRLYIVKNRIDKAADIIAGTTSPVTVTPGTAGDFTGEEGAVYSAVVRATILYSGELSEAYSGVQQSQVASSVSFAAGSGTLQSVGRATADGATTYYIDYERGDDENDGQSPATAWKTLTKANNTVFNPGDRILLEANSIWNGTPTVGDGSMSRNMNTHTAADPHFPVESNYEEFMAARGNGGMLAPQGEGTAANPIIIDLYEFDENTNTVYFSANRRPIINGNGTPALPGPKAVVHSGFGAIAAQGENSPYWRSGAVHFQGQDYWQVRNIEITNSYDFPYIATDRELRATHFFRRDVPKDLTGIAVIEKRNPGALLKGIVIEHCYIHDTQSKHRSGPVSYEFGLGGWNGGKNGAINALFTESTVQYNIIRNIGFLGMDIGDWDTGMYGSNTVVRGNYLENVGADAVIISFHRDTLIESNIAKDTVAAPNLNNVNYASIWGYYLDRGLFQYNEVYGTMYGHFDGEAWDVDDACSYVIYQYNYSHHNAGGCALFMYNQAHSIFRYNISVNDGSGPMWLDAVNDYDMTEWWGKIGNTNAGAPPEEMQNYAGKFPRGTSLFHFSFAAQTAADNIPLIHNNTFYIGDGYDVAIIGNVNTISGSVDIDKRARFINNIFLKDGATGVVRLVDNHEPFSANQYTPGSFRGVLRNNIFWSTGNDKTRFVSDPPDQITDITNNSTSAVGVTLSGNKWANPFLRITVQNMPVIPLTVPVIGSNTFPPAQTSTAQIRTELKRQLDEEFPETDFNDAEKLKAFVSPASLRMRTQYFSPMTGSPAIGGGYALPVSANALAGVTALDGAWNSHNGTGGTVTPAAGFRNVDELSGNPTPWNSTTGITKDFFGNNIGTTPPIGAAAGMVNY